MPKNCHYPRKRLISWALYDWANSAYATTVISGFFPLFFKQYWSQGAPVTTSTFYLGLGNSFGSLVIIIAAPILGAMAEHGNLRKRMLAAFASTGIIACAGLFFVEAGMWPLALVLYVIGVVGFSGANVFYDAMLVAVSPSSTRHRDSAFGFALGYLGGGILFLFCVLMTLYPSWFGLEDSTSAVRYSFICVAVWWTLFTIPLILQSSADFSVAENSNSQDHSHAMRQDSFTATLKNAFSSVRSTISSIWEYRNVCLFLLAYWFYIDGVATVIRMGVDYGLSIGLPANSLIVALLMVQFIGFPATILFGRLAERIGVKKSLWIALGVYVVATFYSYFMKSSTEFFILAGLLGLVQGAVQTLSRSLYSQIIPPEKAGEFFGFQNMMGKSAALIGPLLVGTVAYLTEDPRLGMVSILILFVIGMAVLRMVDATPVSRSTQ